MLQQEWWFPLERARRLRSDCRRAVCTLMGSVAGRIARQELEPLERIQAYAEQQWRCLSYHCYREANDSGGYWLVLGLRRLRFDDLTSERSGGKVFRFGHIVGEALLELSLFMSQVQLTLSKRHFFGRLELGRVGGEYFLLIL